MVPRKLMLCDLSSRLVSPHFWFCYIHGFAKFMVSWPLFRHGLAICLVRRSSLFHKLHGLLKLMVSWPSLRLVSPPILQLVSRVFLVSRGTIWHTKPISQSFSTLFEPVTWFKRRKQQKDPKFVRKFSEIIFELIVREEKWINVLPGVPVCWQCFSSVFLFSIGLINIIERQNFSVPLSGL